MTADHLGSTRVVWDAGSGDPKRVYDYAPFGEEIDAAKRGGNPLYPATVYPSGTRNAVTQMFTGKERDAETGLDFFGARYFSSAQGRMTSPDAPFADQHPEDPQSWNLYAYGRNNPLLYIDPTGRAVELLGDEDQRKKELALLQESMRDKKVADRLYINKVKDGDKTRYFVGIAGDAKTFAAASKVSADLAGVVADKNVVEFGLTNDNLAKFGGAVTYEQGEAGNANVRVLVNPKQLEIADMWFSNGTVLGATRFEPGWINPYIPPVGLWHEFGHAVGFNKGMNSAQTNQGSLDWENRMREQFYGPLGKNNARRRVH